MKTPLLYLSFVIASFVSSAQHYPRIDRYPELILYPNTKPINKSLVNFRTQAAKISLDSEVVERFYKNYYTYNAEGNQTSLINFGWDSEKENWFQAFTSYRVYKYDQYSNLVATVDSFSQKNEYTYDSYHAPTSWISYVWDNDTQDWTESMYYQYENTFNSSNKLLTSNQYSANGYDQRKVYTYDNYGYMASETMYNWDTTSTQWKPSSKTEFENDAQGNHVTEAYYNWNSADSLWTPNQKYVQIFDNSVSTSDLALPEWFYRLKYSHKLVSGTFYSWTDGNWGNPSVYRLYYSNGVTGISDANPLTKQLNLYPNPCKNQLQVQTNQTEVSGYEIMDMMGKVISSYLGSVNLVETENLPTGSYLLKLTSATDARVLKFVKE